VLQYRTFRNTDPPRLVEVWNDTFTGRGAALLPNSTLLERYVFAKPLFDPQGLILAEDGPTCVGFAHAGLVAPDPAPPGLGVTALVGVRPSYRRRGIGSELLRRTEAYLLAKGARSLFAGGRWPGDPFYMGLYGGSESAGFLRSDACAEPFFLHHGYRLGQRARVLQRSLELAVKCADPRFATLRQGFDIQFGAPRSLHGWWRECIFGAVDPLEAVAVDRQSGATVGRTLVWEMEGFSWRWQRPAVGIFDFQVEPAYRRRGLGKLFFVTLLRQLQEQFFVVAELHLDEADAIGLRFVRSVGFEQVDMGQVFEKNPPLAG
jgi:ribosomal protein S18 acetylase RimI-like enzyme